MTSRKCTVKFEFELEDGRFCGGCPCIGDRFIFSCSHQYDFEEGVNYREKCNLKFWEIRSHKKGNKFLYHPKKKELITFPEFKEKFGRSWGVDIAPAHPFHRSHSNQAQNKADRLNGYHNKRKPGGWIYFTKGFQIKWYPRPQACIDKYGTKP